MRVPCTNCVHKINTVPRFYNIWRYEGSFCVVIKSYIVPEPAQKAELSNIIETGTCPYKNMDYDSAMEKYNNYDW